MPLEQKKLFLKINIRVILAYFCMVPGTCFWCSIIIIVCKLTYITYYTNTWIKLYYWQIQMKQNPIMLKKIGVIF